MIFAVLGLIVATLFFAVRAYVVWRVGSAKGPLPPIPHEPDPLDIALLRGGPADVLRTTLVTMAERGTILFDGRTVARNGTIAHVDRPLERLAYDALALPLTFAKLSRRIATDVRACVEPRVAELVAAGLMTGPELRRELGAVKRVAYVAIVLATLVLLRLVPQHGDGPHLMRQIDLYVIALIGITFVALISPPRLTELGRKFVSQLTIGFPQTGLRAMETAGIPLFVALYGVGVLADTPLAGAAVALRRTSAGNGGGASGSGGCGGCGWGHSGACGSGCSSGCGSGCGGGGGCGCGG